MQRTWRYATTIFSSDFLHKYGGTRLSGGNPRRLQRLFSTQDSLSPADYSYQLNIDTLEETDARLRQYIREFSLVVNHEITDESTFASFGVDSLSAVELVIYIEEKLGVRMLDSEAISLNTFGDLKILAYRLLLERRGRDKLQVLDDDRDVVLR